MEGRWRLGPAAAAAALVVVAAVVVLLVLGAGVGAAPVATPTPGVAVPTRSAAPSDSAAHLTADGGPQAANHDTADGPGQSGKVPSALVGAALPPAAPEPVVVDVTGQVTTPGLVRLPPGSRVDDAVSAAGGALPGADLRRLNLARPLTDGEQLVVPAPGEEIAAVPPPPSGARSPEPGPPGSTGTGVLDLNNASADDLDALPGVGPVLAQRILDWRREHGPFTSVEELGEVDGFGAARIADLHDRVRV